MKSYQVWVKQDGVDWQAVFLSDDPVAATEFAKKKIYHGNNVERIELRDRTGCLETFYDRNW